MITFKILTTFLVFILFGRGICVDVSQSRGNVMICLRKLKPKEILITQLKHVLQSLKIITCVRLLKVTLKWSTVRNIKNVA